jgi:hypothetical protein
MLPHIAEWNDWLRRYDVVAVGMQECMYKAGGTDGDDDGAHDSMSDDDGAEAAAKVKKGMKQSAGGWLTTFSDGVTAACNTHVAETIGTVLSVVNRRSHFRMLLGFRMLCDVISAVTEFMVSVLHSMSAIGIQDVVEGEVRPRV